MPLVSVIIPVYNVEKYLDKCLKSIITQTLQDIEVIIVNDGSTDNSQEIINKYCNQYPSKIKAFSKKNGGLGDARNFGLKHAKGDYIAFVDSDDWIAVDILEVAYEKAKKDNSDIIIYNIMLKPEGKIRENNMNEKEIYNLFSNKELFLMDPSVCNKLFKRELFSKNSIVFPTNILHEDRPTYIKLIYNSERISFIDKCGYYYLQIRYESITKSKNTKKYYDIIEIMKQIRSYLDEQQNLNNFLDEYNMMLVSILVSFTIKSLLEIEDIESLNKFINKLKNFYLESVIDINSVNKNKYFLKTNFLFKIKYKLIMNNRYRELNFLLKKIKLVNKYIRR